jgi:prepilin-type N-terminal cleavage/methylation domain-containing protein
MQNTEDREQKTDESRPHSARPALAVPLVTAGCRFRNPKSNGFTLIEIIITLVVLSLGVVGVLSVFSLGIGHSADPLVVGQATQLAQGELDAVIGIKAANGFSAAALGTGTGQACNTNPMLAGYTCSLDICYVAAGTLNDTSACGTATSYKRVAATVTNAAGGSVVVVTLLTNY